MQTCDGRDLPWLQETAGVVSVWTTWNVTFRDLVILDVENATTDVYNLTEHDLGVAGNYEALKALLRGAASASAGRGTGRFVPPAPRDREGQQQDGEPADGMASHEPPRGERTPRIASPPPSRQGAPRARSPGPGRPPAPGRRKRATPVPGGNPARASGSLPAIAGRRCPPLAASYWALVLNSLCTRSTSRPGLNGFVM